jgi:hypothetical protein
MTYLFKSKTDDIKEVQECVFVIPANAGIQSIQSRSVRDWTPAFAGVTALPVFRKSIKIDDFVKSPYSSPRRKPGSRTF